MDHSSTCPALVTFADTTVESQFAKPQKGGHVVKADVIRYPARVIRELTRYQCNKRHPLMLMQSTIARHRLMQMPSTTSPGCGSVAFCVP